MGRRGQSMASEIAFWPETSHRDSYKHQRARNLRYLSDADPMRRLLGFQNQTFNGFRQDLYLESGAWGAPRSAMCPVSLKGPKYRKP